MAAQAKPTRGFVVISDELKPIQTDIKDKTYFIKVNSPTQRAILCQTDCVFFKSVTIWCVNRINWLCIVTRLNSARVNCSDSWREASRAPATSRQITLFGNCVRLTVVDSPVTCDITKRLRTNHF